MGAGNWPVSGNPAECVGSLGRYGGVARHIRGPRVTLAKVGMITRIATQAGMATETTRGRGERQRLEWVAAEHVAVALSAPTVFVSAVLSLGEGQGWHISLEGLINRHNAVGGVGGRIARSKTVGPYPSSIPP